MADSKLTIEVAANVQNAAQGIQSITKDIGNAKSAIESVTSKLKTYTAVAVAAFAAIKTGIDTVVALTDAYKGQATAEAKLQGTLKATRNAVGMTVGELKHMASSYQDLTGISDQVIIGAEAIYAATKRIGEEVMPRATMAALDLSVGLGEDVAGSADKLAKVLANPIEELDSLKESNIILTEKQKEEIKSLAEQNKLFEAQTRILDEVESTYGGLAKNLGNVNITKMDKIANVYADIKEGLGGVLLDTITPALDDLYDSLTKISSWVDNQKKRSGISAALRDGGDLSSYTDAELQAYSSELQREFGNDATQEANQKKIDAIYLELERRRRSALSADAFSKMNAAAAKFWEVDPTADNGGDFVMFGSAEGPAPFTPTGSAEKANAVKAAQKQKQKADELSAFIAGYASLSVTAQEEAIDSAITKAQNYRKKAKGSEATALDEIIAGLADEKAALRPEEEGPETAADYLLGQVGRSSLMKIKAIDEEIATAKGHMAAATEEEYTALQQVVDSLEEEKKAIEDQNNALDEQKHKLENIASSISLYGSAAADLFSSLTDLYTTLLQNQIAETDQALSAAEKRYDEYFNHVSGKYVQQQDDLDRFYALGIIDSEEYMASKKRLDEEESKSREDQEKQMEKLQSKSDKLKQRAFRANQLNQLAQLAVNGAMAISDIYATHAANPILANTLVGFVSATMGVQAATIAAQKYTPAAAGGIATSPTHTLIGEAGPEVILPLNDTNLKRAGLQESSEGSITVVVNIEHAYTGEQLSEDVYRGIEKAQRLGALPAWRYTGR